MPRRGVCGLEFANWATKKPKPTQRLEFEVKLLPKFRGNPGFREIPVWRCGRGDWGTKPPGPSGFYKGLWAQCGNVT